MNVEGHLEKMQAQAGDPVRYNLLLDQVSLPLNEVIGKPVRLSYLGKIHCVNCGKLTKKSWQQGYCYPCTLKLAQCDMCILKPELCHYAQGTCREPEWAQGHCLKPHVVYLANSSGLKVGITRESQVPTRWIDQGASSALAIAKVNERLHSGLIEKIIGEHVGDKTHWQKMLKGTPEPIDLEKTRDELLTKVREQISPYVVEWLDAPVQHFHYPVMKVPDKIKSVTFEKHPVIEDTLVGIKGQYLMFENVVFNVRNHAGHLVRWETL